MEEGNPDPADSARRRHELGRFLWGIPGTLLTLSVIGAPLGIAMLARARRHQHRIGDRNPDPAIEASADGLRGVIDVVLGRRPMLRGADDWRTFEDPGRERSR